MPPSTAAQLIADPIGRFPNATVACFDATTGSLPRRQLDAPRNARFLRRLAAAGAESLLIAASTGHGHLRTVDELDQWFQAAAEARAPGAGLMALLRPEDGLEASSRLLDRLAELNYLAVFLRPGTDLPGQPTTEQLVENLAPLVAAAARRGLPVGLYSIPDVSGCRLTPEAAASLLERDGGEAVVAVKVTEADYATSTRRFLEHDRLRRLKIVQGWDPHIEQALRDGPAFDDQGRQRCGVTSGPMSFAVYQYAHLLAAADRGDWEEVRLAQAAVTALFAAMQDDPRRFADLQRAKAIMGLGHPLLGEVDPRAIERVLSALADLPRAEDRARLAASLDLMGDGPCHERLAAMT